MGGPGIVGQNIGGPTATPEKLFEWSGVVAKVNPVLRCGLLSLTGPQGQAFLCFYTAGNCLGPVLAGARVTANARLIRAGAKVQFL